MTKRDGLKKVIKFFKDADDFCEIATGKHLAWVGKRLITAYGEEIGKKIEDALNGPEEELPADNPYKVLHCRPDATDLYIRGKYRLLVHEFHPDSGNTPDVKEFQRVCEAYNKIKMLRENIDK
jgi:DnaJ-class molecular chaperone